MNSQQQIIAAELKHWGWLFTATLYTGGSLEKLVPLSVPCQGASQT